MRIQSRRILFRKCNATIGAIILNKYLLSIERNDVSMQRCVCVCMNHSHHIPCHLSSVAAVLEFGCMDAIYTVCILGNGKSPRGKFRFELLDAHECFSKY